MNFESLMLFQLASARHSPHQLCSEDVLEDDVQACESHNHFDDLRVDLHPADQRSIDLMRNVSSVHSTVDDRQSSSNLNFSMHEYPRQH